MIKGIWYDHKNDQLIEVRFIFWIFMIVFNGANYSVWIDTSELKNWFEKNTVFVGEL